MSVSIFSLRLIQENRPLNFMIVFISHWLRTRVILWRSVGFIPYAALLTLHSAIILLVWEKNFRCRYFDSFFAAFGKTRTQTNSVQLSNALHLSNPSRPPAAQPPLPTHNAPPSQSPQPRTPYSHSLPYSPLASVRLSLQGQTVHWIGAQFFCVCIFLDSRDKSLNRLKFCRNI